MKKIKRFLGVLSAITVMTAWGMSASAYKYTNVVDYNNIVFSAKSQFSPNEYYKSFEFVVDKNGNINCADSYAASVAVKMKDGTVPEFEEKFTLSIPDPDNEDRYIDYEEDLTVGEFSKYQKAVIEKYKYDNNS